uniref:Uncharacterized protein n=1 Tax=Arundo donax TaxID=35708 RepID=A0A0A8Y5V3_ARUDO
MWCMARAKGMSLISAPGQVIEQSLVGSLHILSRERI